MKIFLAIALLLFVVLAGWGWFKVRDGISNIEACAIEEMRMHSDRDFLMELFQLAGSVKDRNELFTVLEKKYGDEKANHQVTVIKADDGIIWGSLKIVMDREDKITEVRELTQEEFNALVKSVEQK